MAKKAAKTKLKRALLSVSDKSGLPEFARSLSKAGIEIVSTGGTKKLLESEGISAIDIAELTGFPEMMDGRVKTLHPKVHGGLLAKRDDETHVNAMRMHQIPHIDMVVVNLYPFEETIARDADYDEAIENIDIGGPAMIRSAAKNHADVCVVVDPADYESVAKAITDDGKVSFKMRQKLAAKAYARTAAYDSAIANWFARKLDDPTPQFASLAGERAEIMRYGENPHQQAAFYKSGDNRPGVATANQIQGKKLSFNNINDTNAAYELIAEFDPEISPAVAIIKHANPCGLAQADSLVEAYRLALRCDPVSAFGGIIALNQELDGETAQEISEIFTEVIIAPGASAAALEVLATKKNLRLLLTDSLPDPRAPGLDIRTVSGGMLVQTRDNGSIDDVALNTVTKRAPTETEMADLKIAARVAKHVKSNAIVYVKDGATVGIGAGQMSRLDSTRIAASKAKDAAKAAGKRGTLAKGSVMASDAFFPFADGLLAAIDAGATAVIQPGGSIRDEDIIAAADEAGIAMIFTGMRHFKH